MKMIETTNSKLMEILNAEFDLTCNAEMDIVVSDETAKEIVDYVAENYEASQGDLYIEDYAEVLADRKGITAVDVTSGLNGYPKNI